MGKRKTTLYCVGNIVSSELHQTFQFEESSLMIFITLSLPKTYICYVILPILDSIVLRIHRQGSGLHEVTRPGLKAYTFYLYL